MTGEQGRDATLVLSRRQLMGLVGGTLCTQDGVTWAASEPADLEHAFEAPPESAKPWVYWFWLNGNLSREGITADLQAMKRAGIAGALIMSIGGGAEPGPVRFLTPAWRSVFRHAVSEATRLGLLIDMNNDDGWDCGGPWIKPEQAMQKLVWSEQRVHGPGQFLGALQQPEAKLDCYRDVAVLAFPTPLGDGVTPPTPKRTESPGEYVQLEFAQPFTARALVVTSRDRKISVPGCELQVSDNGAKFRKVCRFETGWETVLAAYDSVTAAVPEITGRFYRLLALGVNPRNKTNLRFDFELLAGARLHFWEMKAGFINVREHGGGAHLFLDRDLPPLSAGTAVRRDSVIDMTGRMDASDKLRWQVPEGEWTILRVGYSPTGASNGAPTPEGKGLDCDKLTRAGVEAHFPGMLDKLLDDVKSPAGGSLKFLHNDSWESGCQNWSAGFREEFRKRRGYDLLSYLPVMAGGRLVDGPAVSSRFLWDVRRTLADLIAENYWEHFGELCHARGRQFSLESAGRQQFLYDPINMLSKGDLPMGEFWSNEQWTRPDCKLAASTAHGYGTRVAGAEAYTTGGGPNTEWQAHPFSLKPLGDHAFCVGINRFVFHRYLHQPYLDRQPGITWKGIGINFERTETWWQQSAAWMSYLTRCQLLLQRGVFVGDLCYFTGEGVPNALVRRNGRDGAPPTRIDGSTFTEITLGRYDALPPAPPPGYDFDGCNAELLLRMFVDHGCLTLPGGAKYRVLVLPPARTMTPALLSRIRELVQAGATVVGPKPATSPSLAIYPACDDEVRRLADEIWGDCDGKAVQKHSFGKGTVVWGKPLVDVLTDLGVPADFAYSGSHDADLDYIHRTEGEVEIYFVANRKDRAEDVDCSFRIHGKAPELWHPDTGRVEKLAAYSQNAERTTLPLHLDPYGSVFVLFRGQAAPDSIVSIRRDGRPARGELTFNSQGRIALNTWQNGEHELTTASAKTLQVRVSGLGEPRLVAGPWELRFPDGRGAPAKVTLEELISWTRHSEEGVKYFSGTATYVKEIYILKELIGQDQLLDLDLGKVMVIAEVKVNGKSLGVLWKPPFRVNLAGVVQAGANHVEIEVTNLWPNRMIGDQRLPENQRYTWSTWNPYTDASPLLESGLIGPVSIISGRRVWL